ncbi:DUF3558 domain-containing protein [Amycolatopsis sp., V23-08]|uniref:DUF3558 domain-containing protein n=1 Tax=Amycolatopsis heterodermiae TaxID=3110235 RepID=A0ABU5R0V3_9PSEU|nr:DUF3558 domain-containing protein [Amycolatopsis sp., V23-08]MEA5359807.1 DUF3558 domain-containing protein [Amycolatopsis sp., V23-08]
MNRRGTAIAAIAACGLLLAGCTGEHGSASPAPSTPDSTAAALPHDGAPKVDTPLPSKVLDGSPCETALTPDQLTGLLGEPTQGKASDDTLGSACNWSSNSGSGASIAVNYQVKSDQGLSLAYQNVQPTAARWKPLDPIQGFPAVAYATSNDKRACVIVVGVSDQLAYSMALTLGDKATSEGKDSFDVGPQVADTVLTNLKARA